MTRLLAVLSLAGGVILPSSMAHPSRSAAPVRAHAQPSAGTWRGDFTITIKGSGRVANELIKATWTVDRMAAGTIVLDRTFRGGAIAGTPNTRDTSRYESWIANAKRPITMQVHDSGTFYGPLFSPKNIRLDTQRWTCPAAGSSDASGKVASAILQFDYQAGTFTFETPRFYAKCDLYHRREFVKGPPEWMAKAPVMLSSPVDVEFEIIHQLMQPAEWFKISGPFKAGQTEIVLTRTFPFKWPLQTEMFPGGALDAQLVLVLRKTG